DGAVRPADWSALMTRLNVRPSDDQATDKPRAPLARQPLDLGLRAAAVVGIVVIALWPHITPAFGFQSTFYLDSATTGAITAILVISLNLAMGYVGLLSFMQTGLLAIGGYTTAVAALSHGWNAWLAVLAAIAVTALSAVFVTVVSLRATNIYWGLITMSFNLLVLQVAQQWTGVTGGFNGLTNVQRPSLGQGPLDDVNFYYLVVIVLGLCYLVQRNLVQSGTGRRFQAVRESEATAQSLGISLASTRVLAFGISGGIAGLAGALYAQNINFISPGVASQSASLSLFIALFIGGFATLLGPIFGMVVVTVVQILIRGLGNNSQLVLGAFLLVAIFVLPRGIVGTFRASRFYRGERPPPPIEGDVRLTIADPARSVGDAEGAPNGTVLSARGLCKAFGGVAALSGVDLDLKAGEVHGVIGPNGAGKSTLVSCLTGQLRVDDGELTIRGRPAPRAAHRIARLGVTRVFQVPHLFDQVSVVDNVLAGLLQRSRVSWLAATLRLPTFRREERDFRREAVGLLQLAGLREVANRPASVLSHGQRRLVEILRAVATRPAVLILDEPATGLTTAELDLLDRLIRELKEQHLSILLIEHNMDFVMRLCDRITVLEFGHVIACGTPTEVVASDQVRAAYLGTEV
ncbi:MAG: ABC transporter permease subunit, partial [Trebonia sp.]